MPKRPTVFNNVLGLFKKPRISRPGSIKQFFKRKIASFKSARQGTFRVSRFKFPKLFFLRKKRTMPLTVVRLSQVAVNDRSSERISEINHYDGLARRTSNYAQAPVVTPVAHSYAKSISGNNSLKVEKEIVTAEYAQQLILDNMVTFEKELGAGAFGIVYKANIANGTSYSNEFAAFKASPNTPVCIKLLQDKNKVDELLHEAAIGQKLFNHYLQQTSLIPGYNPGYNLSIPVSINKNPVIMSRFAVHGDLVGYIHKLNTNLPKNVPGKAKYIINCFNQLMHGLKNMHGAGVIHGDIACRNILVSEKGLELADYGKSVALKPNEHFVKEANTNMLPLLWCDQERIKDNILTKFSDIVSLKITMFELIARVINCDLHSLLPSGTTIVNVACYVRDYGNYAYLNFLQESLRAKLLSIHEPELVQLLDHFKEFLNLKPTDTSQTYDMDQFEESFKKCNANYINSSLSMTAPKI